MKVKVFIYKIIAIQVLVYLSYTLFAQENKEFKVFCVAFYNLENLFDTLDTPNVNDFEFTPAGPNQWNTKRYYEKLDNMSKVIAEIGTDVTPNGPVILGVSEIENRTVLEDLVKQNRIATRNYQVIHFDGPDKRGVDVALLYQPKHFKVTNTKSYRLTIPGRDDFFTRDQLLVSGELDGELMHFIVAHWPSRSGGESRSRPLRVAAAQLGRHIVDSLLNIDSNAKVILMGDLNDNPDNASLTKHLRGAADIQSMKEGDLFNPFYSLYKKGIGSLAYQDTWSLFDLILVSKPFIETDYSSYRFYKAHVFNKKFLQQQAGRFKGYPLRSFAGGQYLGGYSDHFPTYILLVKEK
jgi:endonuclease/exonuclease/phosphatase family metal-dependent hydrolase